MNMRHAPIATTGPSVSSLCASLKATIGNPDLITTIDVIERVYHADRDQHWPAAQALAIAAEEAVETILTD